MEDHADPCSQPHEVLLAQDVLAIKQDFPLGALAGVKIVNAVEDAKQR